MRAIWRSLVAALLVAGAVAGPPAEARPKGCHEPRLELHHRQSKCVVDVSIPVPDDVTLPDMDEDGPVNRVRMILPEGYRPGRAHRYPVVVLLHGAGDGFETWVDNTDVEEFAADLGVIIVMPDGGGKRAEAGWYSDWEDGSADWASYHIEHVVPWVKRNLNAARSGERWAVVGLSMGGFGAMSYAARHPDLFSAAASFSGALDTQYLAPASGVGFALAHEQFGTPDERVWGPQTTEHERSPWTEHNPTARARNDGLQHLDGNLWITTGTGTGPGPADSEPASWPLEQFTWQLNQSFKIALEESGTPYVDKSYLGGGHDWDHWEHALHEVLPEVVQAISSP